jgi:hypothetical protein
MKRELDLMVASIQTNVDTIIRLVLLSIKGILREFLCMENAYG